MLMIIYVYSIFYIIKLNISKKYIRYLLAQLSSSIHMEALCKIFSAIVE